MSRGQDPVSSIRVEAVGKRYVLGGSGDRHDTLRSALTGWARSTIASAGRILRRGHLGRAELSTIWALRDVSFQVSPGEIIGVIGANGAGKTTLLKILSRITPPTTGSVTLNGRVGSLLEVGTGFHPELTGRENVLLSGAILGMRRSEILEKFDEIVAFAEIDRFLDTPVKRYSSGMYVRLAFAVAAHLEPEILLVDEVLAVGDAVFQRKCLGKMDDVARSGRTILFVSHNMGAIVKLCERAILLDSGTIKADGPARQVVGDYLEDAFGEEAGMTGFAVAQSSPKRDISSDCPTLTFVELRDQPGSRKCMFVHGEPLVFRIGIAGRVNQSITLGVQVRNEADQLVLHLHSPDDVDPLQLLGPDNVLEVTLPSVLLNDGRYHVGLMLGDPMRNLLHGWDRAIRFEVSSKQLGHFAARGQIRQKAAWKITPELSLESR